MLYPVAPLDRHVVGWRHEGQRGPVKQLPERERPAVAQHHADSSDPPHGAGSVLRVESLSRCGVSDLRSPPRGLSRSMSLVWSACLPPPLDRLGFRCRPRRGVCGWAIPSRSSVVSTIVLGVLALLLAPVLGATGSGDPLSGWVACLVALDPSGGTGGVTRGAAAVEQGSFVLVDGVTAEFTGELLLPLLAQGVRHLLPST